MPPARKAPFRCSHPGCQYTFSKADHCIRHERTHSGSKPFTCDICRRSFARNDALIRHKRLHSTSGTADRNRLHEEGRGGDHGTSKNLLANQGDALADSVHSATAPEVPLADLVPSTTTSDVPSNDSNGSLAPGLFYSTDFYDNTAVWEDLLKSIQNDPFMAEFMVSPEQPQEPHPAQSPLADGDRNEYHGATHRVILDDMNQEDVIQDALSTLKASIRSLPNRLITPEQGGSEPSSMSRLRLSLDHYLAHFSTILPVIPETTFDIRDTAPSALLLMLALGTAFTDSSMAASQGHSLWTLAHAVTITSWTTMLAQRGPYDACPGVQLILTATLGQTFAMLSQSRKLRTTAHVVHALGFKWARQCGMYDNDYKHPAPQFDHPSAPDLVTGWKVWGARELQLRSLLAHYILDGQIAQLFNTSTSVRHSINSLPLPANDDAFLAKDVETWQQAMDESGRGDAITFREYILAMYSPSAPARTNVTIPTLAVRVILESFQSSICETIEAGGEAIGLPSCHHIIAAMVRLYHVHILGSRDEDELAIRWHAILGFSFSSNIHDLCYQLCRTHRVEQTVFPMNRAPVQSTPFPDIHAWTQSQRGRISLLHAISICDRLQCLPLGRSIAIHLPFAAFSAALVLIAYLSARITSIGIPHAIDWLNTHVNEEEIYIGPQISGRQRDTLLYCDGSVNNAWPHRRIQLEFGRLRSHMKLFGATWGICAPMEDALEKLSRAIIV